MSGYVCKQKTADVMSISDVRSDVCASDLHWVEFLVGFLIDDDGLPAAASISMWRRAMEKAILRCLVHGGEGLGLAGHGALHGRTLLHALEVLAIVRAGRHVEAKLGGPVVEHEDIGIGDRKSTRMNSSH